MGEKIIKGFAAALGGVAGLLGEWNMLLTVLAWFMGIDYLTGLICAWRGKSPKTEGGGVSSRAGFDGLARKGLMLLIVLTATLLDRAVGTDGAVFQTAVTGYYIANEGVSILENSALLGVPYPDALKKGLEMMKDKDDND